MICVQNTAYRATENTGVIVSFKYSTAPSFVFCRITCLSVFGRYTSLPIEMVTTTRKIFYSFLARQSYFDTGIFFAAARARVFV